MDAKDFKTGNKTTGLTVVKNLLNNETVKTRFTEILEKKAQGFMASITSLVSSNRAFESVDGNTVIGSALIAATLDLPINQNFGFAYIIPYGNSAQFQMGYKGYIQLAIRTGQYETINATEIYEGELVKFDRLKGTYEFDTEKKTSDKVIGYAAYFKLKTGFEKMLYLSTEQITMHAKRYSKTYGKSSSTWATQYDGMAKKTVLKLLLSKYGILSVQMQEAIKYDQSSVRLDDNSGEPTADYIDSVPEAEHTESEQLFLDTKTEN